MTESRSPATSYQNHPPERRASLLNVSRSLIRPLIYRTTPFTSTNLDTSRLHKEQALSCHCLLLSASGECRRQGSILRGVAVNQPGSPPRQHQRHFTRGRIKSAAFSLTRIIQGAAIPPRAARQNPRPTPHERLATYPCKDPRSIRRSGKPSEPQCHGWRSIPLAFRSGLAVVHVLRIPNHPNSRILAVHDPMQARKAGGGFSRDSYRSGWRDRAAPKTQSLNSHVRQGGGLLRVNLSSGSRFFRPGMEYYRARKLAF